MIIRRSILQFTTALMLFGTFAFAQVPEELNEVVLTGNVFGRSSPDFSRKSRNIQNTLKAGSKGVVVETRRMRSSGSYAVKIRLTEAGKGRGNAKVGDEVWVYYNKKNPWMKFRDSQDMEVQDPDSALTKKSRQSKKDSPVQNSTVDKSVDPNLAMNNDRNATEAGTGDFCKMNNSCGSSANHSSLRDLANKVHDDGAKSNKGAPYDEYKNRRSKSRLTKKDWDKFPEVKSWSDNPKVQKFINYAKANNPDSDGECWKYTKNYGLAVGLLKYRPPSGSAKYAVGDLKKQGFINLMEGRYRGIIKSPDDAPKGAIIVYDTTHDPGDREHGDNQIKTDWGDNGGYVSDFYTPNSFLQGSPKAKRLKYKIIGVMIKPTA